ncbi:callose synthase 7-like [Cucumis melo]|uniref:Callose synthase 7-like n=1 Tax=Cucumis melo TaxID=3656 RepID=A0ABM3KKB7_CUCME|nr:callose synthase 7-like [Cucumis melo]
MSINLDGLSVRDMMYYREALQLQFFLESGSYRNMDLNEKEKKAFFDRAQALVDLKFTYVVSCQVYGAQKKYPYLRVAYIDEREETVNGRAPEVLLLSSRGGRKSIESSFQVLQQQLGKENPRIKIMPLFSLVDKLCRP